MSKQSIATRKYEASKGIIAKSYKLPRSLAEAFKEACERAGVSQSGQIQKMMRDFIAEHPKPEDSKY